MREDGGGNGFFEGTIEALEAGQDSGLQRVFTRNPCESESNEKRGGTKTEQNKNTIINNLQTHLIYAVNTRMHPRKG